MFVGIGCVKNVYWVQDVDKVCIATNCCMMNWSSSNFIGVFQFFIWNILGFKNLTKKSMIWIFTLSFTFSLLVMTSMKDFSDHDNQKLEWITKEDSEVFKNYFSIQKVLNRGEISFTGIMDFLSKAQKFSSFF